MDTRRPPVWWEMSIGLVAFLTVTSLSRVSLGDKRADALANAQAVYGLETRLCFNVEMPMNQWLAGQGWLATAVAYHYALLYAGTSVAVLVYLYLCDARIYRWGRRSILLLNVLAAICFVFYPVAPPRFNPDLTIVDVVQRQHIWGTWGSPVGDSVNQLAALPSLHFALVVWVLVMLVIATRSVVLITLAAVDVVVTALVVLASGNHYPLDLVAGVALVVVGVPITRPARSGRRRLHPAGRLGRLTDALRARAILLRANPPDRRPMI